VQTTPWVRVSLLDRTEAGPCLGSSASARDRFGIAVEGSAIVVSMPNLAIITKLPAQRQVVFTSNDYQAN